jgi:predicted TIM-barrel fold metal-dependent hydrolase
VPEAAARGGRIDVHAHLAPEAYIAALRREGNLPGYPLAEWSVAIGLEMMDRWGTAATVLSLTPPGVYFGDQDCASRLARTVNEALADAVRERPGRFGGLAVLPLPDLDAALAELEYALDELELDGVELFSNVAGTYLGDPRWDDLLEELNRRGALVLVHPLDPPYAEPLPYPAYLIELPMDTTRAAVNLLYSGTLERCPDIKFVLAHLGGMVPFVAHRIRSLTLRMDAYDEKVPRGPLDYLGSLYYDTGLAANEPALRAALAFPGPEKIVFGTDWPYAEVSPEASDPQPVLREILAEADVEAVGWRNAGALIPRLATGV